MDREAVLAAFVCEQLAMHRKQFSNCATTRPLVVGLQGPQGSGTHIHVPSH